MIVAALLCTAATLDSKVNRALSRIGVGPEQANAFAEVMESVDRRRNSQARRAINNRDGADLREYLKKRLRREGRRATREMRNVLSEDQIPYFERYIKLSNDKFLRDAGLG